MQFDSVGFCHITAVITLVVLFLKGIVFILLSEIIFVASLTFTGRLTKLNLHI